MSALIILVALAIVALAIHWRRLRRIWAWARNSYHKATEYRFERIVDAAEASEALEKLMADKSLRFTHRLARVDDELGGFTSAGGGLDSVVRLKRASLWELERYCEALDPEKAWIHVGKPAAEIFAQSLPVFEEARRRAEATVAQKIARDEFTAAQDVVARQLWIATAAAVFSAIAAIAAAVSAWRAP